MWRYITRRLVMLIPVLVGISVITFLVTRFAPGDPITVMLGAENYTPAAAAQLRAELGLDRPLPVQYAKWLERVVQGDLGRSLMLRVPVRELILDRLPTTVVLAVTAMLFALLLSLPAGILAATRKDGIIDNLTRVVAMVGISMPVFWFGLILLYFFALRVPVLPPGGEFQRFGWQAIILPAFTLGVVEAATLTRLLRSDLIEVLQQDYIQTARAKGLKRRTIEYRHALKNALLPVVTIVGVQFANLLAGAVLTETIFDMNGLGKLLVDSFARRDYPVIQGCIILITITAVTLNLLVDIVYAYLDPRVKYD